MYVECTLNIVVSCFLKENMRAVLQSGYTSMFHRVSKFECFLLKGFGGCFVV